MSNENQEPIKIVIAGGGIIGICTAYYLSYYNEYCKEENKNKIPKFDITIVERRSVACSASGYAGGFMARDWCEGERSDPLVRQSYKLHQDLAEKFNGKENYDFRQVETLEFIADNGKEEEKEREQQQKNNENNKKEIKTPSWVEAKISCKNIIGEIDATAQMQPLKFCKFFLDKLIKEKKVKFRIAEVTNVKYDDESKIYEGIYIKEQTYDKEGNNITKADIKEEFIPSDILILALGPWTFQANHWFPKQMPKGFTGHKCQSYLVKPKNKPLLDPQVYFIPIEKDGDPVVEIYPRPDGTVYICSMASPKPFPREEVEKLPFVSPTDTFYLERQQKLVKDLSEHGLNDSEILEIHEATYLPIPPKNYLPVIGKLKEIKGKQNELKSSGVYIASGHNYWGIMTATGTGLALAELIILGKSEQIDIRGLNPLRPGHEDEDEEIFDW